MTFRRLKLMSCACVQAYIPQIKWGKSLCGAFCVFKFARNHADASTQAGEINAWNVRVQESLIFWFRHFIFCWQIHPKLYHFEEAAFFCELFAMLFFVNKTA